MKSIFIALFFSVVTTMVFAQTTRVGIEGGLNVANQSYNDSYGYMSTLPAFNIGITVDVDFKDFAFQPGLLYSGKGYSQTITLNPVYGQFTTQVSNTHLNYFEMPLNLVGKIHTSKNVSINLGGGPYLAMGTSAYTKYEGQTTELRFGENGIYRSGDYGANFIIEGEFNDFFLIKLNYSIGLANISHAPVNLHNHVAALSVAFLFK